MVLGTQRDLGVHVRITEARFRVYDLGDDPHPHRNAILVSARREIVFAEILTDEGLTGRSFGTRRAAGFGEPLAARLAGQDPLDAARLWHRMFTGWRKPVVKGDAIAAIGAMDNALWDLRGQVTGLPVYRLLGGFRSRVPVYAAGGYYADGKGTAELAAELEGFVAAGYRAVKMKVGGAPLREDIDRVRAAREAIGPDIGLMVDANNAWTMAEALAFGRAAERYDIAWLEEPCWPDDMRGSADLRDKLDIPVASGENEYTRWGTRDLLEARAVDILQADPQTCGGLTEWVRIAALASAQHVPMAPHGDDYIGAHAVAAVDNGLTVESYAQLRPWQHEFIERFPLVDGELALPDRPGLGVVVDEAALRRAAAG
jgi:L-alanine-DL-glutamate epimerase-like enolase superfamily enzyme